MSLAQEARPKIALVLSGGGAKGLAHISLLQKLDSLNIRPDFVVGNSMGGIIGGLYAIGYTGDSIASIARNADWTNLIGGGTSLRDVSVEEKSEFDKYLVKVDWSKGKLKLDPFLVNDQNLREFIFYLTFSSYDKKKFDDFSIPFRALATDIVKGKEVILDKGSLAFAMRASMSIPGAFSPVDYGDGLLVDGGVLNNFPTNVAKKMGADIIIGSDVGSGMNSKEKLKDIFSVLFQAGMLSSNLINDSNRALCDILFDHTAVLSYSSSDFDKGKEIYDQGKLVVNQGLGKLVALASKLENYKPKEKENITFLDTIKLDSISFKGISKENIALVKARTNLETGRAYDKEEIIEGVRRAMGTTIFSHIDFNPFVDNKGREILELEGFERSNHQVKAALHYDTYHGAGLLINYTGRNVLGAASRSLITVDVADNPRFRVQHQKNFGGDRNWWWKTELFGQQLNRRIFVAGKNADNMRDRYLEFNNQFNRNLSPLTSYVGFGLRYGKVVLVPAIDPEINSNIFNLVKYDFANVDMDLHYYYNSLNNAYYPTSGSFLELNLNRSIYNNVNVLYIGGVKAELSGALRGYSKFMLDYSERVALSPKVTAVLGLGASFIIEDQFYNKDLAFSSFSHGVKYSIGGLLQSPKRGGYLFPGLNEEELSVAQMLKLNLGTQVKAFSDFYVTPHIDLASIGFNKFSEYINEFYRPSGDWTQNENTSLLISTGVKLSYSSIFGPIDFDFSWVNNTSDRVQLFLGVGYQFGGEK